MHRVIAFAQQVCWIQFDCRLAALQIPIVDSIILVRVIIVEALVAEMCCSCGHHEVVFVHCTGSAEKCRDSTGFWSSVHDSRPGYSGTQVY